VGSSDARRSIESFIVKDLVGSGEEDIAEEGKEE